MIYLAYLHNSTLDFVNSLAPKTVIALEYLFTTLIPEVYS